VTVDKLDILAPICDCPFQEIADVVCALRNVLIYLTDDLLLLTVRLQTNDRRRQTQPIKQMRRKTKANSGLLSGDKI
jgi:hypothetical protein